MDTPIAAVMWPEECRRDVAAILRLLSHLEVACLELGADEAAGHVAEAAHALLRTGAARKLAA